MEIQHLMDSFEAACIALELTINLKKTVLMYEPTPGKTCQAIKLCLRTKAGSRSKVCISWLYSQLQ